MKKITENKMLHYSLVLMTIAAICGIAIGITHQITEPIILERLNNDEAAAYETAMPGIVDYEVLIEEDTMTAILAFDQEGIQLGMIYIITESNKYGDFTVVIGVNREDVIIHAEFIDYQQTTGKLKSTTEANLALYIGLNVMTDTPSSSDLEAGATYSYQSVLNSISRLKAIQETIQFEEVGA